MTKHKIEVAFPFLGVNAQEGEDMQVQGTTRDAKNVRSFDHETGRRRGSQRPGLLIYNQRLTSSTGESIHAPDGLPQSLANVVYDIPRIKYTQLDNSPQESIPATVQGGSEWSKGSPGTASALSVTIDHQGNVYVLTSSRNIERYNPDGELIDTINAPGSSSEETTQRIAVDGLNNIYVATTNESAGTSTFFRFEPDEDLGYQQRYAAEMDGILRDFVVQGTLMYGVFNPKRPLDPLSELRGFVGLSLDSPIRMFSRKIPNPANGIAINGRGDIYITCPSNVDRDVNLSGFFGANISATPLELGPAGGYDTSRKRIFSWYDAYDMGDLSNTDEVSTWGDTKQRLTSQELTGSPFSAIYDTTLRPLDQMGSNLSVDPYAEYRGTPTYLANGFTSSQPSIRFDGNDSMTDSDGRTWKSGQALNTGWNAADSTNRDSATSLHPYQQAAIPGIAIDNDGTTDPGVPWALYTVIRADTDQEARCVWSSWGGSYPNASERFGALLMVNRCVTSDGGNIEDHPGKVQLVIHRDSVTAASQASLLDIGGANSTWLATEPADLGQDGAAIITVNWPRQGNLGEFRVNGKKIDDFSSAASGPNGTSATGASNFILGAPWPNARKPLHPWLNWKYGGIANDQDVLTDSDVAIYGFKGDVMEMVCHLGQDGTVASQPNAWAILPAEIELVEGYLAYKWGIQSLLANDHEYSIASTTGVSGQGTPPETDIDTYSDDSVDPEDWEARLQANLDISDVDEAFTSTHPVLAKFAANNGELKWAFNAAGVGYGVSANDDGDVYTIGEPVAVGEGNPSQNPNDPGIDESRATARHTVDTGPGFSCVEIGNKRPWILTDATYPLQNYEYQTPMIDDDGDVYLPSDPVISATENESPEEQKSGIFKVAGNEVVGDAEGGSSSTGEGVIRYILETERNYFDPWGPQSGQLNGTACRKMSIWANSPGVTAGTEQQHPHMVGSHWSPNRSLGYAQLAPNGIEEADGHADSGNPTLFTPDPAAINSEIFSFTASQSGGTDWDTFYTESAPKYANMLYNEADPRRAKIEGIHEFHSGTGLATAEGWSYGYQNEVVNNVSLSARIVHERVNASGQEQVSAPNGLPEAIQLYASTGTPASGSPGLPSFLRSTYKDTLTDDEKYCFSIFVHKDPSVEDSTPIRIEMYPLAFGGAGYRDVNRAAINVTLSSNPLTTPTVVEDHKGSFSQESFVRRIGDTGWWRIGVVLNWNDDYTSGGVAAPLWLATAVLINGHVSSTELDTTYSKLVWGPMLNKVTDGDNDPAKCFNTREGYTSPSNTYGSCNPHRSDGTYDADGRRVEGSPRYYADIDCSPLSRSDESNPFGVDLRTGDQLFFSFFIKKWNNLDDGFGEDSLVASSTSGSITTATGWRFGSREDPGNENVSHSRCTWYVGQQLYGDSSTNYQQPASEILSDGTPISENTIVRDHGQYWEVGIWQEVTLDSNGEQDSTNDAYIDFVRASPWARSEAYYFSLIGGTTTGETHAHPQFYAGVPQYMWGFQFFVNPGVSPADPDGLQFPSATFLAPGSNGILSVAKPPSQPLYYGYDINGPEHLYYTTGGYSSSVDPIYVHKNRVVAAESLLGEDESSRRQQILVVANGDFHRVYREGETNDEGQEGIVKIDSEIQMDQSITSVRWVRHFDKIYFTDGAKYASYDPLTEEIEEVKSEKAGEMPPRARLITSWRGRLVLGRTVEDPHNWYMSAIGEPKNWDYFPPLPLATQATAGSFSRAGKAPDIINTMIPYSDDLMIFGGDHTIARMTGDPMSGGQIDIISNTIGMMYGESHCMDPEGALYFLSTDGSVYKMDGQAGLQKISNNYVETNYLRHMSGSLFQPKLQWNHLDEGLHIFFLPAYLSNENSSDTLNNVSLFWDRRHGAWWPDEFHFARAPYDAISINGDEANDRELLFLSLDNTEDNTTYPGRRVQVARWGSGEAAKDDIGLDIDSHVFMDVINEHSTDGSQEFRAIALEVQMANNSGPSGYGATARLHVSDTAYDLADSSNGYASTSLTIGRSGRRSLRGDRAKGANMGVHFRATGASYFVLENMHMTIATAGRKALL